MFDKHIEDIRLINEKLAHKMTKEGKVISLTPKQVCYVYRVNQLLEEVNYIMCKL